MRTSIKQNPDGTVTLRATIEGNAIEWQFMAPTSGGYVRRLTGGEWRQCFGSLDGRTGDALSVSSAGDLLPFIRKEWRAYRATRAT